MKISKELYVMTVKLEYLQPPVRNITISFIRVITGNTKKEMYVWLVLQYFLMMEVEKEHTIRH